MANNTTGNIWVIDSVGTLQACGTAITVWSINWTELVTTSSDVAELDDGHGRVLWRDESSCSRFVAFTKPIEADGLVVPTLGSGKLYIQIG